MKKTSITFGLVNINVVINPVIKNNDISFNQLHKKCGSRIKYVKYCPVCKKDVKQSDIIKGYNYEDKKYVTLNNEEFEKLKTEDEKTIEIIGFIDLKEVDPIYYEKSYLISTTSKSKAYSLFKSALEKTKKVALAKTVIGTKFYYVIIRMLANKMIMNTLYFEEEVILPQVVNEAKFTNKELDLAVQLIESLKMKFNPLELIDEYQLRVKKALDAKINGKKITAPKKVKEKSIRNLMTALERSLKNVS